MRYPASEKLEIIRLVEGSALPVRRTLEKVGVPRATFYRWYDLYQAGGPEALDDRHPKPDRVWNRIPDDVRERIIKLAREKSALSPRELAARFTDTEGYFVSEASVYRLLKAHDLIASPAFIVMKAADEFKDKTTAPNQLWQTDFTYLKVVGWGWFYLSTVLDDFSRYIIAWKLCTTMKAEDVTATLEMALEAAALDKARVLHRPRLLSDKLKQVAKAPLAEHHDMIKAVPSYRADQPFRMAILPWWSRCDRPIPDAHRANATDKDIAIDTIPVAEGAGIEEALLAAAAERDRLSKAVCFVILFDAELRSSTLFATTTLLAFCHGPLPMRSRASRYGHDVE